MVVKGRLEEHFCLGFWEIAAGWGVKQRGFGSSEIPSFWILIFKDKVGEITGKSVVANLCIAFQK